MKTLCALVMDMFRWIVEIVLRPLEKKGLQLFHNNTAHLVTTREIHPSNRSLNEDVPYCYGIPSGFVHLPKRWVVERTFGWLNWCRRLSKDYERLPETSETFIYIAMIRIMVRRLA